MVANNYLLLALLSYLPALPNSLPPTQLCDAQADIQVLVNLPPRRGESRSRDWGHIGPYGEREPLTGGLRAVLPAGSWSRA